MRLLFEKSRETNALVKLFTEMRISQPMSFVDASKQCGFSVRSTLPAYHSARTIVARDHQIVVEGIRGFGFQCCNGEGIVKRGGRILRGIRRRARKGAQEAEIALTKNLDRNMQQVASQNLARFRLAADVARPPVSNRAVTQEPDVIATHGR